MSLLVKVIDRNGTAVSGAAVKFYSGKAHLGGCTTGGNGVCHIDIDPDVGELRVAVSVSSFAQEQLIDASAGSYTFQFPEVVVKMPKSQLFSFLEEHFPGISGIVFLVLAIYLAFADKALTAFQQRIILALFALAGAGFATEFSGFLLVNLTWGRKLAIQAGGALAVFVLLYFFVPTQ